MYTFSFPTHYAGGPRSLHKIVVGARPPPLRLPSATQQQQQKEPTRVQASKHASKQRLRASCAEAHRAQHACDTLPPVPDSPNPCRPCHPTLPLQRRQELLRGMTDGDAVLLIGGDLTVTVEQAQGLWGSAKSTHPFARVSVLEPFPTDDGALGGWWVVVVCVLWNNRRRRRTEAGGGQWLAQPLLCLASNARAGGPGCVSFGKQTLQLLPIAGGDDRSKQTTVVWSSLDPLWDEQLVFRDVCAASGGGTLQLHLPGGVAACRCATLW